MGSTQTTSTISVFIDSTVLITASISGTGAGHDLMELALAGRIDSYVSDDVLEESERNIKRKAPHALTAFFRYRDSLASKIVNPSRDTIEELAQIVALKDAAIVAAAFEASAVYLATYDQRHLLKHKQLIWDNCGVMALTPIDVLYTLPPQEEDI